MLFVVLVLLLGFGSSAGDLCRNCSCAGELWALELECNGTLNFKTGRDGGSIYEPHVFLLRYFPPYCAANITATIKLYFPILGKFTTSCCRVGEEGESEVRLTTCTDRAGSTGATGATTPPTTAKVEPVAIVGWVFGAGALIGTLGGGGYFIFKKIKDRNSILIEHL